MEIIVWVAFAIFVTSDGASIVHSDTVHKTRESCENENAAAIAQIREKPEFAKLSGLGIQCSEIKVQSIDVPISSKPKGPSQKDLEDTHPDGVHHGPWRAAELKRLM